MTLLEQLQADALFYILNVLGFVVVVLLTWLFTRSRQAKALAALEQQKKTANAAASGTFVQIQEQIEHEKEYLRRCVQLLEQAVLEGNVPALRQQRQQLIHGLMNNYRPKVARGTQLWMDYYKEDKKQQQALAEHTLIPFLETARQITAAVNAKVVLDALPKNIPADQAFVMEQQTLNFVFQALTTCGRKRWAKQYQKEMVLELAS